MYGTYLTCVGAPGSLLL